MRPILCPLFLQTHSRRPWPHLYCWYWSGGENWLLMAVFRLRSWGELFAACTLEDRVSILEVNSRAWVRWLENKLMEWTFRGNGEVNGGKSILSSMWVFIAVHSCSSPLPSGDYAGFPGCGLLRLHSTFRHDLKIYASDEGRVQMTAAAFAKVNT